MKEAFSKFWFKQKKKNCIHDYINFMKVSNGVVVEMKLLVRRKSWEVEKQVDTLDKRLRWRYAESYIR